MGEGQSIWDPLRVHRRVIFGLTILLAASILLVLSSSELQRLYRDLYQLQERNTLLFYLTFSALMVLAFLTSIFPASIFGVLAGMVFGLVKGLAISSGSILVAALIAFVFARYFFRAASRRIAAKVVDLARLEARLSKHGWRYALLIRSAPIAPFAITSYALSLMPIKFNEYLLTTLASLPFLFTCVYIGSVSGYVVSEGGGIDRGAILRLALTFSAATLTMGLFTYLLQRLVRWVLGPNLDDSA
jgi:uncharacterized membrane protein YdjX (TVP38/TMEM64 family)